MSTLVVANFNTGLKTDREPFLINNDSFPVLENMYVWRGRVRRKRGTTLLGRLRRDLVGITVNAISGASPWTFNVFTLLSLNTLSPNASVIPGSLTLIIGAVTFTDAGTAVLASVTPLNSGTINYATGSITVTTTAPAASNVTVTMNYYPDLPVMGLEDHTVNIINFPILVAFDTRYSYQFNGVNFFDVTKYKLTDAPFNWSGADYQQFWSTNYEGAMWVTNNKPGMHFKSIVTWAQVTDATHATLNILLHGLSVGDYIFVNEATETVPGEFNLHSGVVTAVTDVNNVVVNFPSATFMAADNGAGGIAQYMTRSVFTDRDGIRWYDGDPASSDLGWVNYAPPLSTASSPEYLVGAKIIIPFKDRLLFFGTWRQTSAGAALFYPNQLVYTQNGTPYYSLPLPTPTGSIGSSNSVDPLAVVSNVVAKGGRLDASYPQEITVVSDNGDVLIVKFETRDEKLVYTGDDSLPFFYQSINNELGGESTFTGISLDMGVLSVGNYGLSMTTQSSAQRFDLDIPDQVFDIVSTNNGTFRVTAFRDFRNEFIYFSYPSNVNQNSVFPSKTLLYNYRDNTWAVFDENFTHYGNYRRASGYSWSTLPFRTWATWTNAWNFGASAGRYPNVIGGNQQGFVLIKDDGCRESVSQYIQAITAGNPTTITSPSHCLNSGDYIEISGVIGDDTEPPELNGIIFQISVITENTFTIDSIFTGTYAGGGVYRRLSLPNAKTKQFPFGWETARKTIVGTQRFFLDTTATGQIKVDVYTSQNSDDPVNTPLGSAFLPFTNIVQTKFESSDFYNTKGAQTWHRMSNSFIGDTIQFGFTLSDAQMRDNSINSEEITLHAIAVDFKPGPLLV